MFSSQSSLFVSSYPDSCFSFPLDPSLYCAHVQQNCSSSLGGRVNYLALVYCTSQHYGWIAILALFLMLIYLFIISGSIIAEYLLPNLATIAQSLRLSDAISGVTIIAIGNCLPDLITNIISIQLKDTIGLAFGNIIGGVLFTVLVVFSTLSIQLHNVKVESVAFFSLIYLLIAIGFMMYAIMDMNFSWIEGVILIGLFTFYISAMVFFSYNPKNPKMTLIQYATSLSKQNIVDYINKWPHKLSTYNTRKLTRTAQILDYAVTVSIPKQFHLSLESATLVMSSFSRINDKLGNINLASSQTRHFHDEPLDKHLESIEYCPTCRKCDLDSWSFKLFKHHFFPIISTWKLQSLLGKIISAFLVIPKVFISLTTIVIGPSVIKFSDPGNFKRLFWPHRWITGIQALTKPIFIATALQSSTANFTQLTGWNTSIPIWSLCIIIGILLLGLILTVDRYDSSKSYVKLLSIPGLASALTWSFVVNAEIIRILKTMGVIFKMPDELLGLTFFVVGNNLPDLVTISSAAHLKMNSLAVNSAVGQPIIALLLNMGFTIIYSSALYGGYKVTILFSTLLIVIAAITWILITLIFLMANGRKFNKYHGISGICLYMITMAAVLVLYFIGFRWQRG